MLRIRDRLAGTVIEFNFVESKYDLRVVTEFVRASRWLAIDTESTGVNCYRPDWKLRTVQIGDDCVSFVVPATYRKFIGWLMAQEVYWIGHNGPHDMRSIDACLGYSTGVVCAGETYLPAHHYDSRKIEEGGTGHGLKELAIAHIDRSAGKWETALKKAFKEILIPIPGQVYKSGPRKGTQKFRKAKLEEGYALLPINHPAYIAYAASDPILTYRLWQWGQPIVRENCKLYRFDHKIQMIGDVLQRRAMRLDAQYTERLSKAYSVRADDLMTRAAEYGCRNIHSGRQVAETLIRLGVVLRERTPTGQYKVDGELLRALLKMTNQPSAKDFIRCVLGAKQAIKRRESYTDAMLREMDGEGRVHPSINTLAARTTRMSVSGPPLQQLPTKDREDEE